jgi:hypothetical protein
MTLLQPEARAGRLPSKEFRQIPKNWLKLLLYTFDSQAFEHDHSPTVIPLSRVSTTCFS